MLATEADVMKAAERFNVLDEAFHRLHAVPRPAGAKRLPTLEALQHERALAIDALHDALNGANECRRAVAEAKGNRE